MIVCVLCSVVSTHGHTSTFDPQNTIFKTNQRTDQLKSQMNWDQQALEAWLEESARQDEDAMTLEKYARADESKIKVSAYNLSWNTMVCTHRLYLLVKSSTGTHVEVRTPYGQLF